MDRNKLIIRNVIRALGIIVGAASGIMAFILGKIGGLDEKIFMGCCTITRVGAIVLFVQAAAFMIYDIILKAFPLQISTIGLVLAAVAFVGSFLIAPGCSQDAMIAYSLRHAGEGSLDAIADKFVSQLIIGSWMIVAGGIFYASYNSACLKQGK